MVVGSIMEASCWCYKLELMCTDEFKAKLAAERGSGAMSQLTDQLNTMTITAPDSENWDADARDGYVAGYDPKQKLANSACL